jgi:beta-glucosidase
MRPSAAVSTFAALATTAAAALAIALAIAPAASAGAEERASARVEALIAEMSLEEKAGELSMDSPGAAADAAMFASGKVGSVLNYFDPVAVRRIAEIGRSARGIPVLQALDVIHGYRTITPVPIAEAATFDPDLARAAAELAGRETRAAGVALTFAPVADIARDPRWGRAVEGSGEDTALAAAFTRARVEGFHLGGIGATLKHFAGYGAVEGGRDYDAAEISPSRFANTYLPPYRAAVAAGVDMVMTTYVAVDGLPATADRRLMTDLLRDRWGFTGVVVSDMKAVEELVNHGVARDGREATLKAFRAGVDMDMDAGLYRRYLPDLVRAGLVAPADLDRSVRRVLALKERLGLFDRPLPDPDAAEHAFLTPDARALARRIATESFVLLKNDGDVLPLAASARRIAIVGALAGSKPDTLGPHGGNGRDGDVVTILEAVGARAAGRTVTYAPGCDTLCSDGDGFDAAEAAARAADVVVAVLGEPRGLMGEAASRADLGLPGRQEDLLRRLKATGKPVVLLVFNGRPLTLAGPAALADAVMLLWAPGTEGGNAVADVLFGDAAPGGRLPFTFPRSAGQIPLTYDSLPTGRPGRTEIHDTTKYQDLPLGPLYPFGYGLTYAPFQYDDLALAADRLRPADTLTATVTLRNTGTRPAKEVAQLYVNQPVASLSRPVRQLKAWRKVELKPGEARRVTLAVPVADLGFVGSDGVYRVEPGPFRVFVGGSSAATLAAAFEVVD